MDQRARKLTMLHKASEKGHRLYVLRKEGGRGLTSIEDWIDASVQGLKDYIKKSKEKLTKTANRSSSNVSKNRKTI